MKRQKSGARISKAGSTRPLSWPTRNYFAELDQPEEQDHPVDRALARDSGIRAVRRRAARQLRRLRSNPDRAALLDFEAARNQLDGVHVETAFNLGCERGRIEGRIEGLRHALSVRIDSRGKTLRQALLHAVQGVSGEPGMLHAALLEIAWAFAPGIADRSASSRKGPGFSDRTHSARSRSARKLRRGRRK